MSALGEFDLIRRYFTPSLLSASGQSSAHVAIGVGDDCAVINVPANTQLAISVDTHVVGVHFHADADPALIAARALRCAASDLVAMGAEPLGFTLAITLPSADENWLENFSRGLLHAAQELQCPLLGGDTTRGPLCISIQVHGSVPSGKALRRSGATVGDAVWVSGTLGDGAAALALLEKNITVHAEVAAYLMQRFYHPAVDFTLGVRLRDIASSAIDVSDGLLADLGHLCQSSAVAAQVVLDALPISKSWANCVSEQQAQHWALRGGDDYRLCFTASPQHAAELHAWPDLYCVGRIVDGAGVLVVDKNGVPCETHNNTSTNNSGFRHF